MEMDDIGDIFFFFFLFLRRISARIRSKKSKKERNLKSLQRSMIWKGNLFLKNIHGNDIREDEETRES